MADAVNTIRKCCTERLNGNALDKAALLAARIIRQRLWGRVSAAANARDVPIEQEALSLVAPLFAGNPPDIWLYRALKDTLECDDTTLFLKFQAVAIRCATQELFHRWSETDPQGAKLWRNLNRAIGKHDRLLAFPHDKPEYITLGTAATEEHELQLIEFERLRSRLSYAGDYLTSFANKIVELLSDDEHPGKSPVIRIDDLFRVLRESISSSSMEIALPEKIASNRDPCMAIAMERATISAMTLLHNYIDRYAGSGKFDEDTCSNLSGALEEILKDCADGGPAMSYYEYVRLYVPGLRRDRYQTEYRTRFEYLAELVQTEFYDTLRKELGE